MQGALSAAVVFIGAAGGACAQNLPAWFSSPPADDAQAWYAVGEGPDPEAARRNALRAVAARLRSSIEGRVENTVIDANGKVTGRAMVKTSEEILKTEFTRVEVVHSTRSSVGVLVLVKVDRPAFVQDTQAQLQVAARPVAEAETALQGAPVLEQYLTLRRVLPDIEKAMNLGLLLVGAGDEATGRPAFDRYSRLQQLAKGMATRLVFEVRAKPEDADIVRLVGEVLANQGMRSAAARTRGASVMTVDTQTREASFGNDKMLRMVVRFSVVDEQGRAVASREHQVSGSSRFDFKGARESAVGNLGKALGVDGNQMGGAGGNPLAAFGFKD